LNPLNRLRVCIEEVLGGAFTGEIIPTGDEFKLIVKPLKMQDGAIFRLERIKAVNKISLNYYTWDDRLLRFGIEIAPKATLGDIVAEAQKKAEEMLEEASHYRLTVKGVIAVPPWTQSHYELRPKKNLKAQIVIKSRNGEMTVTVPRLHPEIWQRMAFEAIPDSPLTIVQTGPAEFTAYYQDEIRPMKVRYVQGDIGEEHEVKLLPHWENQQIRVRDAFGREMIPDEAHPVEDGVVCVKAADVSPPDSMYERVLSYTFGADPTEYKVRIRKDDTPESIREGLKRLHPGMMPAKMLFEGGEVEKVTQ
jgi:hypothetical protein